MKLSSIFLLAVFGFLFIECQQQVTDEKIPKNFQAPLLEGMGDTHFPITTTSKWSQRFFNQGLVLAYGFNHVEAGRAFEEAARLDSTCAMCYWGLAYVLGPNYNAGMDPETLPRANEAVKNALSRAKNATPREQMMIEAMAKRYPKEAIDDRSEYDKAYARALKEVYQQYSDDPNIVTIYAESLMDLHPWDLYDENREAKEWTPEIVAIIEGILEKHPNHAGANHLYIHAVEASASPDRSLPSAKVLETAVPGSGHLVHMPSHVYIRTGNYHEGTLANQKAVLVDSTYVAICNAQGMYPMVYYPHNWHFLAATAALEGNSAVAIDAAFQIANLVDKKFMKESGYETLQHYYIIPYYTLVKFGRWNHILELPQPNESMIYPNAIWSYAQGMAFAGKGDLERAKASLISIEVIEQDTMLKNITVWDINSVDKLVRIAKLVLKAEILSQENKVNEAIQLLKEAVAIEDRLSYNEPPDWFFSVRHYLGYLLLKTEQYEEAEQMYVQDLKNFPENGYALNGLQLALEKQGKTSEAEAVKIRFNKAWKYADTPLLASIVDVNLIDQTQRYGSINKTRIFSLEYAMGIPFCGVK